MNRLFAALWLGAGAWLAGLAVAGAATITIESMHYSAAHPVPHFSYKGDTVAGDVDRLRSMYEGFVHCRNECATETGRATAVLTLSGPGGNYHEGLALADFLRANSIATVVEAGAECYSACAFAFLGGTGYSSSDRIGQYVDRMIEPGGIVGFHAPYRNEESIRAALLERTPSDLLAESRDSLSLMVKELVKWNVDAEIIHYMLNQGPEQLYTIANADDYYLVRTALPPIPTTAWIDDMPAAIRNACLRLLAVYERADPLDLRERITAPYQEGIGQDSSGGTISGYRLSDRVLDVGFCGATDASLMSGGAELEIALYMNPGIDGTSLPVLSFFNRDSYFSTVGIGASALKRIFQRGGIGHWFLPIGVEVSTVAGRASLSILANRFFSIGMPELPPLAADFIEDVPGQRGRVSHNGNVWVFEQTGNTQLFDAALRASADGVALTHDSVSADVFIREGSHADGTYFSLTGYKHDGASYVRRILVLNGGAAPAADETALLRQVNCGTGFAGLSLAC